MAKADPQRGSKTGETELDAKVAYWKDEIDTYERLFQKWEKRGRKINKKYKDIRSPREEATTRYNILWANVQTRLPVLYARNPKVVVERRYRDADPVGRVASEILERSIQYTLDHCNDAWQTNRQVILDYELPGRGTCWIRYEPHFKKQELDAAEIEKRPEGGDQPSDENVGSTDAPGEAAQPLAAGDDAGVKPVNAPHDEIAAQGLQVTDATDDEVDEETLEYEETKVDYVYWEDFGHTWARCDDEVRGKWRRVYMDREELEERFMVSAFNTEGLTQEEIDSIPLDWSPKNLSDTKIPISRKKAIVYEIWDRRRRKVLWLVKNYAKLLDERDDMLGLKDFFPCPRPLCANLTNEDLIPTPNFTYYQDQANEIDELSTRINAITKALKVAGVRDASAEGLDRLLSEGVENQLVPVTGWSSMKEKGGLAGSFELLPMDMIADTLQKLRDQRTELIDDVYQLTGIADIVRGQTDPNETAAAQQLKGQFSMVRIEDSQTEVQRFCRDQIVIIGQIVAGYDIETLKAISGVKLLTAAEKQQIQTQLRIQQLQAQMAQQQPPAGSPSQAPGVPPAAAGAPHPAAPAPAPAQNMPPHTTSPPPPAPSGAPGAPPGMPPQGVPATAGGQPQVGAGQATPGHMAPGAPSSPMTPAPGQAPVSPEKMKLLELPTWEEVAALLKNPVLREFKLDMETDSTSKMDDEAEKRARLELIETIGQFIQQAVQAGMQAPEIMPMLGELLMFGIRAFRTARAVEQTFEDMMEALQKMAKQPRPNPELQKVQAQAQADQAKDAAKAQSDQAIAQAQMQMDTQLEQHKAQLAQQTDQQKMALDQKLAEQKAELDAQTQKTIAELQNHFEAQRSQFETAAKERIAEKDNATKLEIARMGHDHQQAMTKMQHDHEQKMVKLQPKPDKEAA